MDLLILVIIAVLPPVAFMLYIHRLDRIEPEPHGLIIKAMALGAAAVIPAALVELLLSMVPVFAAGGIVGAALKSFIVIAPIEETVKLGVVLLFIWNNVNFNEENDGIVYTGAAAIGFALLENIMYVLQSGFGTGIMRAVTSIPLHTFTGVIMGYFVGIARFAPDAGRRSGTVWKGFIIAYLIHAVYDTLVLSATAAALLIVPLVIALFVFGGIYLKKGVAFSRRRWNGTDPAGETAPAPVPSATTPAHRGSGKYKAVIARILFALCAGFWALLVLGMLEGPGNNQAGIPELIAGGIILTVIPATVGIILEVSYHRHRKPAASA
ncbi:MAG TPA: PrsW family glutamic-type intramembrane protease [Spirochaetota bacterium]|nr:PrsW family glutamic-type intramembrane protease [Spirochaetota bacterium]HQJ72035.1 PrsW family glutamic-type intramembrane protease [Spirochaetota bacterium]HRS78541.1 PrsW family glutamic-type intramembrane protease [Spirochaetota bacterium]HRT77255.1 PrsW family glutamic-type intramembrane protease [Spirochaetota bacterium]